MMKKKICPYCDQVITGNYCKGCRRFVRKPVSWEVDYYLNERHPASEENCQYHGDLHTGRMVQEKQQIQTKKAPAPNQSVRTKPKVRKRLTGSKGVLIVAVYVALSLAVSMFGMIKKIMEKGIGTAVPEYEAQWMGAPVEEIWEPNSEAMEDPQELSEDEVREAGIPCNGYGHFDMKEEEAVGMLESLLAEHGYGEQEAARYSFNLALDGSTWFNTQYEYILSLDGEYRGYVDLCVDTADGRMHGLEMVTNSVDDMYAVADVAAEMLEKMGVLEEGCSGRELFEETVRNGGDGTYGYMDKDSLEISCTKGDDGFCMMSVYMAGHYV